MLVNCFLVTKCYALSGGEKKKKNCIEFKVLVIKSPWIFLLWYPVLHMVGFPGGSDSKESACNTGDLGSVPRQGWSLGEENDYPLQYSCLENSMDRGARQAPVHGVTKSWTWLRDFHFHTVFHYICDAWHTASMIFLYSSYHLLYHLTNVLSLLWAAKIRGLPQWLSSEESACNAGGTGLIPRCGRSPGAGHGNPLQYSCLENPRDGEAWWTAVYGVAHDWSNLAAAAYWIFIAAGATL